jgi:hypothetical protein
LRTLSKEELEREIDRKIADSHHELKYADAVSSEMAMTNTTGFHVDDYKVTASDLSGDAARIPLNFHTSGNQDENKLWSGTEINGTDNCCHRRGRPRVLHGCFRRAPLGGDEGDDA